MSSCIDYFYNILSRRDYSAAELRKKAHEKGFEQSEVLEAINYLQEMGAQSDSKLAANLIASYTKKYGKSVMRRKCMEKGISMDLFDQAWNEHLEQMEGEEIDQLAGLKAKVMRKYSIDTFRQLDPKTKSKLWNYLQYRGFNPFELLQKWQIEEEALD
ncbi:regulatory protein RecX [Microcoleus sp. FACHB-68]|uniref:regulatory protein RecX n=1 Tax=Microcoleus sp. FACHB-68 TaxID=2692826 RepID=UPI0016821B87|nr:regulatory protein RecX [Microcoleus sp. FACHB-68]MBD1939045.1 regulatory protein RecX [Microcoleus sp. FACHB-68]